MELSKVASHISVYRGRVGGSCAQPSATTTPLLAEYAVPLPPLICSDTAAAKPPAADHMHAWRHPAALSTDEPPLATGCYPRRPCSSRHDCAPGTDLSTKSDRSN